MCVSNKFMHGVPWKVTWLVDHTSSYYLVGFYSMMTSSNGNIFRVTGPLCGEFRGPGEFPTQRPVTRSFDVYFDLPLNKRLSKQPWGWWFETLSWSLWRQCNVAFVKIVESSHSKHKAIFTLNDVWFYYNHVPDTRYVLAQLDSPQMMSDIK